MGSWGRARRSRWRVIGLGVASLALLVGSAAAMAQKRAPSADLVVRSVSKPPASVARGASFSAKVSVANVRRQATRRAPVQPLGASTARAQRTGSYTRLYLSRNARKDSGDVALSPAWPAPALKAGKVARHSWRMRVPNATATGVWFVIACADATHVVRETNERNNCRASARRTRVKGVVPPPPANRAPTGIALSNSTVAENQPRGTTVGALSTVDRDAGDSFTYSLVAGAGSDDNAKFQISGGQLQTSQALDFEAGAHLSVRVQTDDGHGGSFQKALTMDVSNVNEAPTEIALAGSSVPENQPWPTTVGMLSAVDPDAEDSASFSLVAGAGSADNGSFTISRNTLQTNAVFDFEAKASYSIRVRTSDSGSLSFEKVFTVTVTGANDAPVAVNDSYSTAEDTPLTVPAVGVLANDADVDGNPLVSVLNTGPAHGSLSPAADGSFVYTPDANFHGTDSFAYHANDGTTDSNIATVTITVNSVNDPPVAVNDSYVTNEETPSATVPPGFSETQFATGLAAPTAMAFAPDGRLFVAEQGGALRVVKNGTLLSQPFVTVTVDSSGERGLLGVAFDPNFTANGFVYIYYTATTPTIHNRVSRFTASGDVALPGSEVPILDLNNLSGATNHNGGAIHFGPDGKLYIAVGDNANGANAQSFSTLLGKILRITSDGSIPSDNPFFNSTTGNNGAIWALGLRNPYTFTFQPGSGRMFINDVGENTWEEIDDGIAGSNYGWPTTEGPTSDPRFRGPIFSYGHGSSSTTGCAITGGAFYNPPSARFPASYVGDYFFADFCSGWIRKLDPGNGNSVADFASGAASPVGLLVGSDGLLYYLTRGGAAGTVYRVSFSAAPSVLANDSDADGDAISAVLFTVPSHGVVTLNPDGSFLYVPDANFNGTDSFTYKANDGQAESAPATVTITVNPVNDPIRVVDRLRASAVPET